MIKKYCKTTQMAFQEKTNGGLVYLIPEVLVQVMAMVTMIFIWKILLDNGADVGMSSAQMITYTFVSVMLSELLTIKTMASAWNYSGELQNLFRRPMAVFGHLVAQTLGTAGVRLAVFSLPMFIVAPLFGVNIIPASPWVVISLFLCVSLGFAIDFLFTCITIRVMNISWLVSTLRSSIIAVFSGAVIPLAIMPFHLDKILVYQPFASLSGAVLSIYTGISAPLEIITIQLAWNGILWPLAMYLFYKSREVMVSNGG